MLMYGRAGGGSPFLFGHKAAEEVESALGHCCPTLSLLVPVYGEAQSRSGRSYQPSAAAHARQRRSAHRPPAPRGRHHP